MNAIADLLFRMVLRLSGGLALRALMRAAENPEGAQKAALAQIVNANRNTVFGKEHGFAAINTTADFKNFVPLASYEDLRPYIERQVQGEEALVSERPVMYARTSGTLATPKLIPITPCSIKRTRKVQQAASWAQMRACAMFDGKILVLAGAKREDSLTDGTPIGAVSGLIYETMPRIVRQKYIVPAEVFAIEDARLKYAIVAHLALLHEDLTAVSTANPSTFLRLRDHLTQNWYPIIADIRRGHIDGIENLPAPIYRAVKGALRPDRQRAAHLTDLSEIDRTTINDLWPRLAGILTWTGGSCAVAAETLRKLLDPNTRLIDVGYVASELRGTAVVDIERNLALPMLQDVYFEFVRTSDWESGGRETLSLHELDENVDYQVIVTTRNGLYRYVMNDILRSGPRIGRTVSLSFVQKSKGFTSITGEKLSEQQVGEAMLRLARTIDAEIRFYVVLADEAEPGYHAYVHIHQADGSTPLAAGKLGQTLDDYLRDFNIEYAAKRESGRLPPLELHRLQPETPLRYRDFHIEHGQREAQFKVLTLQYRRECLFDFLPYVLS